MDNGDLAALNTKPGLEQWPCMRTYIRYSYSTNRHVGGTMELHPLGALVPVGQYKNQSLERESLVLRPIYATKRYSRSASRHVSGTMALHPLSALVPRR